MLIMSPFCVLACGKECEMPYSVGFFFSFPSDSTDALPQAV